MEVLNEFLEIIIIGVCLCVGYIIKNLIPTDKINRYIPLIMGIIGVLMSFWINNFAVSPEILLSGLISGLASTGMYELFKQFLKKGE